MTPSEAIRATRSYIDHHWEETFRISREDTADELALPFPHTVPSTDPTMWLFFYWDTYFTNLGLIRQGRVTQARNNAENVLHLIETIGFVPNISVRIALNRSQIPVAAVLFDELHRLAPDRAWLERIYAAITREYAFWTALRESPNGLAANNTHADPKTLADFYHVIKHRLRDIPESPVERLVYLKHKMAECEVWDFNPRFDQRCADFNAVDTNSVLFQVETIAAGWARELGRGGEAAIWQERARRRRELIDRYLWDEARGFYFDYDWTRQSRSTVVSAAPYFALWTGACSAAQAAALVRNLSLVERAHGLITCAEGSNASENTYQWDAPNAWPPLQAAAIIGLQRYGYHVDAKRLAEKYILTCARNLEATGQLWEKYNALTGGIDVADEYKMPPMMGWTAGTFLLAAEVLER
ncbi:trehalase family glycosidase [Oleiharenicola lentus]|uniref:trehalase family glycosidase n=1 Tax=Oleiharenicola lentus TaxID=2508720 RepID=UPI003F66C421